MNNWKKDLENISNKLKRGDDNVHSRSNTRSNSRSDSRRSRNVDLSKRNRKMKIKNIKGGEIMITVNAALKDLEKIVAEDNVSKVIKEVARILIKFISTMRSNQLLTDADKVRIQEERKIKKDSQHSNETTTDAT